MKLANYFDNAATTALHPEVREAMLPWLGESFGNASSLHAWGREASAIVESSREEVAELIGAEDPSQIVFTSGATESLNTVLSLLDPASAAISPFEHSAVRVPATQRGFSTIPNNGYDLLYPESGELVVTACSNETGAIYRAPNRWHCDATQAIGKAPFDTAWVETASFSAHKFHGPPGVGILYLADPYRLHEDNAHQVGGGHEQGRRAGTLNVAGIIGLATALRIALRDQDEHIAHAGALRQTLAESLADVPGLRWNNAPEQSPFICSITAEGIAAQPLVIEMDTRGFGISSGSACSSGSPNPSAALIALGLSEAEALGTFRISFAYYNSRESTFELAKALQEALASLRHLPQDRSGPTQPA